MERIIPASLTVTAPVSNNTKGSWVEYLASTARDYTGLLVTINVNANNISVLYDVAIGGSGSEQVVVPDLLFAGLDRDCAHFFAPVAVPAGSRLSSRIAATNAGGGTTTGQISISGVVGSLWGVPPGGQLVALGATLASSGGTGIDSGAASGTFGSWTDLSASTARNISAISILTGNRTNATPADLALSLNQGLQIGVGATPQVIYDTAFTTSDTGQIGPLPSLWLPCTIPAGSRVACRTKMNTTDATDRVIDVIAYGLAL